MLLILTISTILISLCILLHYSQHFRCQSCTNSHHRLINIRSTIGRSSNSRASVKTPLADMTFRLNWCCGIRNDEEFDFFPISFLLYMMYILIISCIIVFKYISEETTAFHQYYHNDTSYNFETISTANETLNHTSSLVLLSYIDWIIYVLIIFAMIWESLFGFYRYYTTMMSARFCFSLGFIDVFKHFFIYMLAHTILFIIQTQIYYFLFPFIIILYLIINIYWVYQSSSVIIVSVQQISGHSQNKLQKDLLYNVRLMRIYSLLFTIFTSIYISLFTVIYNIKIVYYFPFIWCISIFLLSCVFIRNRQFIIKKCCCCILSKENSILQLLHNKISNSQLPLPETHFTARSSFDTLSLNHDSNHQYVKDDSKWMVCVDYIDEGKEPSANMDTKPQMQSHCANIKIDTDSNINKQTDEYKTDQIKIKIDTLQTSKKEDLFRSESPNIITSPVSVGAYENKLQIPTLRNNARSSSTGDLMTLFKKDPSLNSTNQLHSIDVSNKNQIGHTPKVPKSVPVYITNMISRSCQYFVNKTKIVHTPQSVNVIDNKSKNKSKNNKLLDNLSVQWNMDTLDKNEYDLKENMPSAARTSITITKTQTPTHTQTQTHTLNIAPIRKPSNNLLLPNAKNHLMTRSSSNPLITMNMDTDDSPANQEDEKYDSFNLMTPSVPKTYSASMDSLPKPKLFDNIGTTPIPDQKKIQLDLKHLKSQSGNDMNNLESFTIFDALCQLTNDTVISFGSYNNLKGIKSKNKRYKRNGPRTSQHTKNDSVSSLVNLIVSQGLYDKKSATKILKSSNV